MFNKIVYMEKPNDTAAKILKAAEDEFIENGFGKARMLSIAAKAGVSHSMLHYYFRSKEELFKRIFGEKIHRITDMIDTLDLEGSDFTEVVRQFVCNQFDLMRSESKFVLFVMREVLCNRENLSEVVAVAAPAVKDHYRKFNERLGAEVSAGRIRDIDLHDLIADVVSINLCSIPAAMIFNQLDPAADMDAYYRQRRSSNADFIVAALRPSGKSDNK